MADRRDLWIAGQGRRNVEDARRRAAANTAEVLMSQSADWYKNKENRARTKDVLQHIPAVTTNQNETRNMYQMLMNQMKGGDKGARLIDTRGLPAGARRIGRTLFQDPSKSAGFGADLRTMLGDLTFQDQRLSEENRTSNPAAIHVNEYNPFPIAGFGEEYYKKEFPYASALSNIAGLAEKSPTLSMISNLFPKKERIPLERDPRFTPIPGSADWESSVFDEVFPEGIDEVIPQEGIAPLVPEHIQKSTLWGINQAAKEGKGIYGGRGELSPDFDYGSDRENRELSGKRAFLESVYPGIDYDIVDPSLIDDLYEKALEGERGDEVIPEIIPNIDEIFEDPEIFNNVFSFPEPTGFTNFASAFDSPFNVFESAKEKMSGKTDQEILDLLVKRGFLVDTTLEEQ